MTHKVLIEVELDHAESVANLLDLAGRIHMGQIEEISSLANQRLLLAREAVTDAGIPLDQEGVDRLEAILLSAKTLLGHPSNGSWGIGGRGVSIDAKRGYEVQKALRKALHDHLRPEVRHTVDSTGVTVRYATGDVPVAKVVEA